MSVKSQALKALDNLEMAAVTVLGLELAFAETIVKTRTQVVDLLTPFQHIPGVGKIVEGLADVPMELSRDLWLEVIKEIKANVAESKARIRAERKRRYR